MINSTAVSISWRPPIITDQNGMIISYDVVVVDLQENNITNLTIVDDTTATIKGIHMFPCNYVKLV